MNQPRFRLDELLGDINAFEIASASMAAGAASMAKSLDDPSGDEFVQAQERPFEALPHTWPAAFSIASANNDEGQAKLDPSKASAMLKKACAVPGNLAVRFHLGRLFADPLARAQHADTTLCPDISASIWHSAKAAGFTGGLIRIHNMGLGTVFSDIPKDLASRSMVMGYTSDELIENAARHLLDGCGAITVGNLTDAMGSRFVNADLSISLFCNKTCQTSWADPKAIAESEIAHLRERGIAVAIGPLSDPGMAAMIEKAQAGDINIIAVVNIGNDLSGLNREGAQANHMIVAVKDARFRSGSPKNSGSTDVDGLRRMTWVNGIAGPVVANQNQATSNNEIRVLTDPSTIEQSRSLVARAKSRMDSLIGRITRSTEVRENAIESSNKDGMYSVHDGRLMQSSGGLMEPCKKTKQAEQRCRALIELRDAMIRYIAVQKDGDMDEIQISMLDANEIHDRFVSQFGAVNAKENMSAFSGDPYRPLLRATEVPMSSEDDTIWVKSKLLLGRCVYASEPFRTDDLREAVLESMAVNGMINLHFIAEATGLTVREVLISALSQGLVFIDPVMEYPVAAFEYLSGDIVTKINDARNRGRAYEGNVAALSEVMPPPVSDDEIEIPLGATWCPCMLVATFLFEELGLQQKPTVVINNEGHMEAIGDLTPSRDRAMLYGTTQCTTARVVDHTLRHDMITITKYKSVDTEATIGARDKQIALRDAWTRWLASRPSFRQKLGELYNTLFNRFRHPDYSEVISPGRRLRGMSTAFDLRPVQRQGIARIICSPLPTLLAHDVGVGKTLEIVCSAMELKRMGKARKPVVIVPTSQIVEQFEATIAMAYPEAYVVAESQDDKGIEARAAFFNRIMASKSDIVVMTHSTFCMIRSSCDALLAETKAYGLKAIFKCADEIATEESEAVDKKARESLALENDVIDLGIDWIFVDEAHYFKNLPMGRNAIGIGSGDSKKSVKLLAAIRAIAEKRGDGLGVTFATGTPVSNSMIEVWTMLYMLAPAVLDRIHSLSPGEWINNFAEQTQVVELSPDAKTYKVRTKYSRFRNVPELMAAFRTVADVVTSEMVGLPLPKAEYAVVACDATKEQKAFIDILAFRAERGKRTMRATSKKEDKALEDAVSILSPRYDMGMIPASDNMLAITSDGRKAALDMRLINESFDAIHSRKIESVVENLYAEWLATRASRMTQLVFCDMGTSDGSARLSVYDEIATMLVDRGVPRHEIIFASDMATDASRREMMRAIRSGKVRIAIGSTMKMGVGTNAQDRVSAVHEVDAPWRPADVKQRIGRAIRQGNVHYDLGIPVKIFRYVTKGTFDAYIWQMLEHKAKFIDGILSSQCTSRSMEEVSETALSYAEVKALATGNPVIIEKAKVESELGRLGIMLSDYERSDAMSRIRLGSTTELLARAKSSLENLDLIKSTLGELEAFFGTGGPLGSEDGLEELRKVSETLSLKARSEKVYSCKQYIRATENWTMELIVGYQSGVYASTMGDKVEARVRITNTTSSGWWVAFPLRMSLAASLGDQGRLCAKLDASVKEENERIVHYSEQMQKFSGAQSEFPHHARMRELETRLREINAELGIGDSDIAAATA